MLLLMPCGRLLVSRIWLRSGPGSPDLQKKTVRTLKHDFTVQIVLVFQRNPCQHKPKSRRAPSLPWFAESTVRRNMVSLG